MHCKISLHGYHSPPNTLRFSFIHHCWSLTFCLAIIFKDVRAKIDFFLNILLLKDDELVMSVMKKIEGVTDFVLERTCAEEHLKLSKSGFVSDEGHSGCKSQNIAIRALKGNVLCQICFKWTYQANLVNWWGSSTNKLAFSDHSFRHLAAARWQDSMSREEKSWNFFNFPHWFFVHFWTMWR